MYSSKGTTYGQRWSEATCEYVVVVPKAAEKDVKEVDEEEKES